MFKTTPNDDALAGVIAREIAHVVANHEGEKLSEVLVYCDQGLEYCSCWAVYLSKISYR